MKTGLPRSLCLSMSITLLALPTLGGTPASVPYATDFETGIGPEWSSSSLSYTDGFTQFTGEFDNQDQTLSLTNLVAGKSYTLQYDLYVIDSWDGNNTPGPDYFNVIIAGSQVFHETFNNVGGPQSYPNPPDVSGVNLGFSGYADSIYRSMELAFTPTETSAQITFQGQGLQGVGDEGWGVDNVRVVLSTDVATTAILGATLPAASSTNTLAWDRFSITSSRSLLPAAANDPNSYRLREAGGNGVFGDGDDTIIGMTPSYNGAKMVSFVLNTGPLQPGHYRFETTAGLLDQNSNAVQLFSREFTIANPVAGLIESLHDDTLPEANPLPMVEAPSGSGFFTCVAEGTFASAGDVDYWRVDAQAGDALSVQLEADAGDCYPQVVVVNAADQALGSASTDGWSARLFSYRFVSAGSYYLRVYSNNRWARYQMRVDLGRTVQLEVEGNDSAGAATPLNINWSTTLGQGELRVAGALVGTDSAGDYFGLGTLSVGNSVTGRVDVPFMSTLAASDIQLSLEMADGSVVAQNTGASVSSTIPADGAYFLHVQTAANRGLLAQYLLRVDEKDTVPPYVTSDNLPVEGTPFGGVLVQFTVNVSEDLDPRTVSDAAHYELRNAGPDNVFGNSDDQLYALAPAYDSGLTVTLAVVQGPLQPGKYRLHISGLKDRSGNALAPEYVRDFAIAGGYFIVENRSNGDRWLATSLSPTAPSGKPDGSFTQYGSYGVGDRPHGIASADFNGDGIADLVTANIGGGTVSVLLGKADGTFGAATNFDAGPGPLFPVVADLNGDGKPDLVVPNYNGSTVSVLLGNGDGTFAAPVAYGVGNNPWCVALGDFNHDGRLDVAAANYGSSTVSVLLGKGDGTFQDAVGYSVAGNPEGLAAGDVDGDGNVDLVTANWNGGNVSILKGNGDGTFADATNLGAGTNPRWVSLADLDGDGVTDILVLNVSSQTVGVLKGLGGGAFAPMVEYAYGGSDAYQLAVADFNGDGKLDVAVSVYGSSWLGVFLNQGNGILGPVVAYWIGGNPLAMVAGDFNHDGRTDLATANYGWSAVCLWLGNQLEELVEDPPGSGLRAGWGRGQLTGRDDYDYWSFSAQAGDLLTVAAEVPGDPWGSALYYRLERTDGNASYVTDFGTDGNGRGLVGPVTIPVTGRYTLYVRYNWDWWGEYRIRVALVRPPLQMESEYNNDRNNADSLSWTGENPQTAVVAGAIDTWEGQDYYWLGNLAAGTTIKLGLRQPSSSPLAGVMEIYNGGTLVTNSLPGDTNLTYSIGDGGNGAYYARVLSANDTAGLTSQYILSLLLADMTPPYIVSDNLPDEGTVTSGIVDRFSLGFSEEMKPETVNASSNYALVCAGADGAFGTSDDATYSVVCTGYANGLGADYRLPDGPLQPGKYRLRVSGLKDRAGNVMSLMHERQFTVTEVEGYVFEGRNDGGRGLATTLSPTAATGKPDGSFTQWGGYGVGNNPHGIASGDFNGDGIADLVTANYGAGTVSVLLGKADGSFGAATNFDAGPGPLFLAVGDLNGDGKPDLVVPDHNSSTLSVLLGNGDGTFAAPVAYGVGNNPWCVALGDFNRDGRLDVAVANYGSSTVSVLLGKGDGTLQDAVGYGVGSNPNGLAAGDVDGDGNVDLVTANWNGGNVSILKGKGDGTFADATNLGAGTNPRWVSLADLDGDGVTDILVLNVNSQSVGLLKGLGGGAFAPMVEYAYGGSDAYQLAVADFNGDGKPDVAVSVYGSSWLGVFLNQGNGVLGPVAAYWIGGSPLSVVAGDFNGDGLMDLAIANYGWNGVYLWWGNRLEELVEDPPGSGLRAGWGRGNIQDRQDYDYWSFSAQAGDLLTVAAEVPGDPWGSALYYRLERTDGNASYVTDFGTDGNGRGLAGPVTIPLTGRYTLYVRYNWDWWGEYRIRVALARPPLQMESEYNNDRNNADSLTWTTDNPQTAQVAGAIDTWEGQDYYWLGNLSAGTTITLGLRQPSSSPLSGVMEIYNGGTLVTNSLPGDTNLTYSIGDGGNGAYYVRVYSANDTAGLKSQYILSLQLGDTVPPYIVSDSLPDQGTVTSGIVDRFSLGFSEEMKPETVNASSNYALVCAGVDGAFETSDDATYTVVCTGYANGLGGDYRLPDGPLQPGKYRLRVSGLKDRAGNVMSPIHERQFTVAGVEGYVLENRGNGSRALAMSLSPTAATGKSDGSLTQWGGYGVGSNPQGLATADLNGDGLKDLVTGNFSSGNVSVLLGRPDGSFSAATNFDAGSSPCYITLGDVNGDGKVDVIVPNYYWSSVSVLLGNGDGTFQARATYGVGANPVTAVVGDFNGDGKLDIATANWGNSIVSVLLNKGDGTFSDAVSYSVGTNPYGLAVGDVDGDSKLDLVSANYNGGNVSLLKGNGDGTFQDAVNLAVGANPRAVALGDLNGDGIQDIVALSSGSQAVSVLTGLGGGAFAPAVSYPYGGSGAEHLLLADLNADGKLDVVIPVYGSSWLGVMLNQGNGTFGPVIAYGIGGNPICAVAGDFNGDGIMDVATANYGWNAVYLWWGNRLEELVEDPPGSGLRSAWGRGNVQDRQDYDYWSFSAQAGDLLTVAAQVPGDPWGGALYYRLERTDGNASYVTDFGTDGNGRGLVGPVTIPATGRYTLYARYNWDWWGEYRIRVALARPPLQMESEYNNDRNNADSLTWTANNPLTAVVAGAIDTWEGQDYYLLGNLSGGTTITLGLRQPGSSPLSGVMEIYNGGTLVTNSLPGDTSLTYSIGDGGNGSYYARVYAANDTAGLKSQYILSLKLDDRTAPLVTADSLPADGTVSSGIIDRFDLSFSEDMKPETVSSGSNYTLVCAGPDGLFGTGDDAAYTVVCTGYSSGLNASYRLADGPLQPGNYLLRVTGLQDRAGNVISPVHERQFTVAGVSGYVLENRSNGDRGTATSLAPTTGVVKVDGSLTQYGGFSVGSNPQSLATADFNGDGLKDLVTGNWSSGNVSVLLGQPDGSFGAATNFDAGSSPYYITLGDVNGDGKVDVIVPNYYWSSVSVLLGNGDGTFQARATYGVGANPVTAVVGDFNGDGKLDIATANYGNSTVSVLLNKGDGTFQDAVSYSVGSNPFGLAVGDVDGDSKLDLVSANYNSGNVSLLKGNGDGTFQDAVNLAVGANPRAVVIGDVNGDGKPDLVVLNAGSQTVSVLLGQGGGSFAAAVNYAYNGSDAYHLALADLNADGKPDVVISVYGSSWLGVMLNQGDGTFGPVIPYGIGGNPICAVVGDFNGDGIVDVATANYGWNGVYLWWGNRLEELTEDPPGSGLRSGFARGNLKDTSDYDYWSFSAQAGDLLTVVSEVPGSPWGSSLYYRLERADGNASYVTAFSSDGNGRGMVGPVTMPVTGRYTLYVRYNWDYQGEYRFGVSLARPPLQMESEDNGSLGQANSLTFATNGLARSASVAGRIRAPGEKDYFSIGQVPAGYSIVLSTKLPASSTLAPAVSVHDSADFYMLEAGLGRAMDGVAEIDVKEANTFYAVIEGAEGTGGLAAQYVLNILVTQTGSTDSPNLFVTSVDTPSGTDIQSGQAVPISFTVQNVGAKPTPVSSWSDRVVLSTNRIVGDADDILLGVFPHNGTLAAGASYTFNQAITIPNGITGDFYVIVVTDYSNAVDEGLFEGDNVGTSANTFHVTQAAYPDLRVEQLTVSGPDAGLNYTINWTTANRGEAAANGGFKERLFVRNQFAGVLITNAELTVAADLPVNGTLARSATVPGILPGNYQVLITTDSSDKFYEMDSVSHEDAEQNNLQPTSFAVIGDLQVADLRTDPASGLYSGADVVIRWSDHNAGDRAIGNPWSDRVEVANTTAGQPLLDRTLAFSGEALLASGQSRAREATLHLPDSALGLGTLQITVTVDVLNNVAEFDPTGAAEQNNAASIQREAMLAPYPDLVATNVVGPATALPGQQIQVTWAIANQGTANVTNAWTDLIQLSLSAAGADAQNLGSLLCTNLLAPGQGLSRTGLVMLPTQAMGDYYLVIQTDGEGTVKEGTNENNNVAVARQPIHVQAPDLVVDSVTAPSTALFSQPFPVQWVVRNAGDGPTRSNWSDRLYASNQVTGEVLPLGAAVPKASSLTPGATYTNTQNVALPLVQGVLSGRFAIMVVTDADQTERELNENNNIGFSLSIQAELPPLPDLAVAKISAPVLCLIGQPLELTWVVTNQASGQASGPWVESVYLYQATNALSGQLLASFTFDDVLAAHSSLSRTQTVILPTSVFGQRFVAVMADSQDNVIETVETNNTLVLSPAITITVPDLVVESVKLNLASAQFGQPVQVTWVVRNTGTGPANARWADQLALSSDAVAGGDRALLTQNALGALAAGDSYTNQATVTMPLAADLAAGTYYLIVTADIDNAQMESSELNNSASTSLSLSLPPLPDLAVANVQALDAGTGAALTQVLPGQAVLVSWITTNQGAAAVAGFWNELVQLSSDPLAGDDTLLGTFRFTNSIASHASVTRTQEVAIPVTSPIGSLYFVVTTDNLNDIVEQVETNNTAVSAAAVQMPARLTLTTGVPTLSEGGGIWGMISRNGDDLQALTVTLSVSDLTELRVPATLQIPAQQASATFWIEGLADGVADGPQTVTLRAQAAGFPDDTVDLTVQDTDVPHLIVQLAGPTLMEGGTLEGTVTRELVTADSLRVTLVASGSTRLRVPAYVNIPGNQAAVAFELSALDNFIVEGTRSCTVSARAAGYQDGAAGFSLLDNDLPAVQLHMLPTTVSEADGVGASHGTLSRSPVTSQPVTIELDNSNTNALWLPGRVTIPGGASEISFQAIAINNDITNAPQTVVITPYILDMVTGDRLTNAEPVTMTVTDDDGPTLKVAIIHKVLPEGRTVQGAGTVTRNTGTAGDLVVHLASSDLTEATVPPTVTIPDGQTSVAFDLTTIDDGIQDGNQNVTITASATDYASGSDTFVVSDMDLPDLTVKVLAAPVAADTEAYVPVSYRVENQGVMPAPGGWGIRVFLTRNPAVSYDLMLDEFQMSSTLPAGGYFDRSVSVRMPRDPGDYWVVVQVDVLDQVREILEDNNVGVAAQSTQVQPAYYAVVQTDVDSAPAGTPIPMHGQAFLRGGTQPAPHVLVNIHIMTQGMRRVISALADDQGAFATTWTPLPGEAGYYEIGAAHPGESTAPVQDQFRLLGIRADPASVSPRLVEGSSLSGTINLRNLADLPLTGLQVTVGEQSANLNVQQGLAGTILPGSGDVNLAYAITALNATIRQAYFVLHLTCDQQVGVDVPFYVTVDAQVPRLVANPSELSRGLGRGTQTVLEFDVVNEGGVESGPITVSLPAVDWMSLASDNPLPSLPPGRAGTNRVTLVLSTSADMALGDYTGALSLNCQGASLGISFQFRVMSDRKAPLYIFAEDEYTFYAQGSPRVTNAVVTVTDVVSGTVVTNGVTDTNGVFDAGLVVEGYYRIEASADKHQGYSGTALHTAGDKDEVHIFMPRQAVSYTWTVEPTDIEDRTRITIETTFETVVPMPVITVEPPLIDLAEVQGGASQIEVKVTNHGLVAALNMHLSFDSHPLWKITPLISDLGTLAAMSSITIPVQITRLPVAADPADCTIPCTFYGRASWTLVNGGQTYGYTAPITVIHAWYNCTCPSGGGGGGGGGYGGGGGWGGGGGGGGGGVVPVYTPPPDYTPTPPCTEEVCARVKLRLDQTAVISRDAFKAKLEIDNSTDQQMTDIEVTLDIRDSAGGEAAGFFGIRPPVLDSLSAVDGTGVLGANSQGGAVWIIIPAVDAAPDKPLQYTVGGTFKYTQGGAMVTIPLAATSITVYPLAQLTLDYFHDRDVFADDPFTPEVEPSIPYSLAVMVHNTGKGTARNMRIISGQPTIVENESGLLIDFKIIATEVAGQNMTPTLTADFGDIGPGEIKIGRWLLTSTLQGQFTDYKATFEHLDDLGNKKLLIITNVAIHEMRHLVQAPVPLDDGMPDFLVNEVADPPLDLPDTVYLSDGTVWPVQAVTTATLSAGPAPDNLTVQLSAALPNGFVYLQVADPGNGQYRLTRVVRSDNREIYLGTNVWTTDRTFADPRRRPIREYKLHLFDYESTGAYTLYYEKVGVDTEPPVAHVAPLPAQSHAQIPISWSGTDGDGSGIAFYDIFVSEDGGPFQPWLQRVTMNGAVYQGSYGKRYAFYCQAVDQAGNRQAAPGAPDAETTVALANRAPQIAQVPNQHLAEGDIMALDVVATDPDGDALSFSLLGDVPAGLQIDPTSGHITWATSEATGPTTRTISVQVQDNGSPRLAATNSFQVVVDEVNAPPVLAAIPDQKVDEGKLLTYTAQASDSDLPPQTLTFGLIGDVPLGATINANTGEFRWQPNSSQGGTNYLITVQVQDNGVPPLSSSASFKVTVRDVRPDFALSLGNAMVWVGKSGSVPIRLVSGLDVTNVSFVLEMPVSRLTGLQAQTLIDTVSISLITLNDQTIITIGTGPNETLQLDQTVGQISFTTDNNPHSAEIPLRVSNLRAVLANGQLVEHPLWTDGRVCIVGQEFVLEMIDPDTLKLYGETGSTFLLQDTPRLGANWADVLQGVMLADTKLIQGLSTNSPPRFYRALRLETGEKVILTIKKAAGGQVVLEWAAGTLQAADVVTGPYQDISAQSPFTTRPAAAQKYYRVQVQ